MEDVIGGFSADDAFATFLSVWQPVLARRVTVASEAFAAIDGVRGLILAGDIGARFELSAISFSG